MAEPLANFTLTNGVPLTLSFPFTFTLGAVAPVPAFTSVEEADGWMAEERLRQCRADVKALQDIYGNLSQDIYGNLSFKAGDIWVERA